MARCGNCNAAIPSVEDYCSERCRFEVEGPRKVVTVKARDGATARPTIKQILHTADGIRETPMTSEQEEAHHEICELTLQRDAAVNDHSQLVEKVRGMAAEFTLRATEHRKLSQHQLANGTKESGNFHLGKAVIYYECADQLLRALGDDGK